MYQALLTPPGRPYPFEGVEGGRVEERWGDGGKWAGEAVEGGTVLCM